MANPDHPGTTQTAFVDVVYTSLVGFVVVVVVVVVCFALSLLFVLYLPNFTIGDTVAGAR